MPGDGVRSFLFVPGDREALILKALASAADAVIVDLEDAVAPDNKAAARSTARAVLDGADRRGKAVVVRLNAYDTGSTVADLAAILGGRPSAVMLPKCEGADDLARLSFQLDALEERDGVDPGLTRILSVATETATATLGLGRPAGRQRLWGMLWGAEDLAASVGAAQNRDEAGEYTFPFQFARSQCLYAAKSLGVAAIDSVFTDFKDAAGLEREARRGLRDGFSAKAAIHPAQVEVINRVMTPTPDQVAWAREVVTLLDQAAVARLDGRMVDLAHKRIAERLLARAAAVPVAAE